MAKDPDPARPGFNPENGAKPAAKAGGWDPATGAPVPGPPGGAGSKTEQEQAAQAAQAALLRQEKRELLFTFQKQTQLTLRHLQSAYHKFKAQDKSHSGVLDLKGFCKLLNVEATGEFSRLIKLYDRDGTKKIDVNEFLLGVSNFTGASAVCCWSCLIYLLSAPAQLSNSHLYAYSYSLLHAFSPPGAEAEDRVDFCFLLYDEDLNGFITVDELTKIVMANHLAADHSAVDRKVATIMRQCDGDRSGHLDREEFKVCAEKFPNLLFPSFTK
jgi:Ca2+-binding EF-hand superfamily protein